MKPTQGIILLQKQSKHDKAKKRTGAAENKPNISHKQILEINPKPSGLAAATVSKNNILKAIKEQTHLTEPINMPSSVKDASSMMEQQNSLYPQQQLYQKSSFNGYVQAPQNMMMYPTLNPLPSVKDDQLSVKGDQPSVKGNQPSARSKPCVPSPTNLCPTSPLNLFLKPSNISSKQNAGAKSGEGKTPAQEMLTKHNDGKKKEAVNQIKLPIQAQAEGEKPHSAHGGKILFLNRLFFV